MLRETPNFEKIMELWEKSDFGVSHNYDFLLEFCEV